MADYFTRLSVMLELPSEAIAFAIAGASYLHALARGVGESDPAPEMERRDRAALQRISTETDGSSTGCAFSVEPSGRLWVRSDETAQIPVLVRLFKLTLARHAPNHTVSLQWVFDCDKLRPGEFAGGAAVITAHDVRAFDTGSWLFRAERRAKERLERKAA